MTSHVARPGGEPFAGAVLAGGRSRRMGRDKALVRLADGRPLALVAASALQDAGAEPVAAIGGVPALEGHGLAVLADLHPGEGPLGGMLTALRGLAPGGPLAGPGPRGPELVVVLTCDLPAVTAHEVRALVDALTARPDAVAAVATVGGRRQFLTAAYRRAALPVLADAFARGERAVRRAASDLDVIDVAGLDPARLADVDTPEQLALHLAKGPPPG